MKPIIGITSYNENKASGEYNSIECSYIKSVAAAGGIPIIIPVISGKNIAAEYIMRLDGLLFTGGGDLSPSFYNEKTMKETRSISLERDICEKELFSIAIDIDMPVFGICRGAQIINAFSGGTLYQDINVQRDGSLKHSNTGCARDEMHHKVYIEKESGLYNILQSECIGVNSFHHQAVKDVAPNFKITAKSTDGIIEGIECINKNFVMGVQWHPEELAFKYPEFMGLFKTFVNESEIYRESRKNNRG